MVKLLINSVTYHMPQNRVSEIIMHVALNTINNVLNSLIQLACVTIWSSVVQ